MKTGAEFDTWISMNSLFLIAYFFSWDVLYVNALSSSRGRGKITVEFFSAAISVSVPRNLSWRAWGFVEMISAAEENVEYF